MKALPNHLNADRVIAVALTVIQQDPKLLECTKESLFGSVVKANILGLSLTKELGHAWLIPFSCKDPLEVYPKKLPKIKMCQFQIGYKGLLVMMRNSDKFTPVVDVVYDCDEFVYERGLESDHFVHKKNYEDRKEDDPEWVFKHLTFVYLIARYKDGSTPDVFVYPKRIVEKHRKMAQSQQKPWANSRPAGPQDKPVQIWWEHYAEMVAKTGIRICSKYLPLSTDQLKAIQRDADIDLGAKINYGEIADGKDEVVIEGADYAISDVDSDEPQTKPSVIPQNLLEWIKVLVQLAEHNSIAEKDLRMELEAALKKKLEDSTEKKIVKVIYDNFVKKDIYDCNLHQDILDKIDEIRKAKTEVKK